MCDGDGTVSVNTETERFENLAKQWRDIAEQRDEAGNHVRAQTLRRCAGELELTIDTTNE